MIARRLIPAALALAAIAPLAPSAGTGAETPAPVEAITSPGGALEPLGPADLTAAQRASRERARRALGLAAPDDAKARRHLQLIERISSRIARRRSTAATLRRQARRFDPSAYSSRLRTLAGAERSALVRDEAQLERQRTGLRLSLSVPTAATCVNPPQPSPYSIFTLPSWSNTAGWTARNQYGTIQLADVTGDGGLDVLGRGSSGVRISDFQSATGTFASLPPGPALSDAAGWGADRFALTIRSGDVDGDGRAEVVALDAAGKVATFDGGPKGATWTQLPGSSSPAWDDRGTDWSEATHYETLRLVDLDGDGSDELLARAAKGIVVASFDVTTQAWTALPLGPPLSDAEGWNSPEFSSTIRIGDVDGRPGAELVALDAGPGFDVYSFSPPTGTWSRLGGDMPEWPAGATDWRAPGTYETVRLANLDGDQDGVQELLVRSKNGLVVAGWNATSGGWEAWPTSPVLADVGGWNAAGYYESLRVGDVDGDGGDEVFIRGGEVLEVLEYTRVAAAGTDAPIPWTVHTSQPLQPSSWQDPENYRTFTIGDVDGDGDAEVLGRDDYGVRTFDFQDGGLVSAVTPFPAFSGAECTAYAAIAQANASTLGGADLRAAYSDPGIDPSELKVPSTRPSGVTAKAWAVVAPQITREIAAATKVRDWHVGKNGMSSVITQGYESQLASMDSISGYFGTKSETATGEVFPWLEGIAEAIGLVAEGEEITGDLMAAGISSILTFTNNELSKSDDTKVTLEKDKLAGQIARMSQQATDANTQNETYVPREYGLMVAMQSAQRPGGLAPWQTMWRQSDIYFWQTFAAEFWNSSYCDGPVKVDISLEGPIQCPSLVFQTEVAFTDFPMKGAWQRNPSEVYWMGRGNSRVEQPKSFREKTNGNTAARHILFGTAPPACRPPLTGTSGYFTGCRLGLDPGDVYLGRKGWNLTTRRLDAIA